MRGGSWPGLCSPLAHELDDGPEDGASSMAATQRGDEGTRLEDQSREGPWMAVGGVQRGDPSRGSPRGR